MKEQLVEFFKANPTAMDPKYGGDPVKAAESIANLQATYTKTAQELSELKKKTEAVTTAPVTTTEGTTTGGIEKPIELQIPTAPSSPQWADLVDKDLREHGSITPATVEAMTKAGIPDHLIKGFQSASDFAKQQRTAEAVKVVGSREALEATLKFAQTLPPNEVAELNKGLASPAWQTFLTGLNARRLANTVNEPNRSIAVSGSGVGGDPNGIRINSFNDLLAHQHNPKYRTDPGYKAAVEEATKRFYGKKK